MEINDIGLNLVADFPYPDFNLWLQEVEKSLKGKFFDEIKSITYENIIKEPLYINSNILNDIPNYYPYRRGFHSLPYKLKSWGINMEILGKNPREFNKNCKKNIESGINSIKMNLTPQYLNERFTRISNKNDLIIAFEGIDFENINLMFTFIDDYEKYLTIIDNFAQEKGINPQNIIIDFDPFENCILRGRKDNNLFKYFDFIIDNNNLNFKYTISTESFKESGCSIVQELALVISKLIEILSYFRTKNYDIDFLNNSLVIKFKTGNDFFLELAKYRAFRILWYNFLKAYEIDLTFKPVIYTCSLKANKSFLDYHTNIIRNAIEGFSAILGNVDILELIYFDDFYKDNISEFTERVTRNIQILFKEEFNLTNIIDPAGGSYYVETITDELVKKSWNFFKEIQYIGGFNKAIETNFIQNKILKVQNQKIKNFTQRKEVLIGVNKYPNLNDEIIDLKTSDKPEHFDFLPLIPIRFAEPFEKLRIKAIKYEKCYNKKPTVYVATYGNLSQYKARLDFINDFINVGGIQTEISHYNGSIKDILDELKSKEYKVIIFCASDDSYNDFLSEIIPMINTHKLYIKKILAGYPTKQIENLKKYGIDEFIHINSNIVETLNKIYNWIEK